MSVYDAINGGDWMAEDRARELRRDVADTPCALCSERIGGGATQTRTVLGIPYLMHRACYEAPARIVVERRLQAIAERDLAAEAAPTAEAAPADARAELERLRGELHDIIAHAGDEAVSAPWLKRRLTLALNPPRVVASFQIRSDAPGADGQDVQAFADEQWHGIDPTSDAAMPPAERRAYIRERLDRLAAARTPTVHVQGDWDDSEGR